MIEELFSIFLNIFLSKDYFMGIFTNIVNTGLPAIFLLLFIEGILALVAFLLWKAIRSNHLLKKKVKDPQKYGLSSIEGTVFGQPSLMTPFSNEPCIAYNIVITPIGRGADLTVGNDGNLKNVYEQSKNNEFGIKTSAGRDYVINQGEKKFYYSGNSKILTVKYDMAAAMKNKVVFNGMNFKNIDLDKMLPYFSVVDKSFGGPNFYANVFINTLNAGAKVFVLYKPAGDAGNNNNIYGNENTPTIIAVGGKETILDLSPGAGLVVSLIIVIGGFLSMIWPIVVLVPDVLAHL